ncbi:MAG: DNA-3-methyladenine glycosylase [Verrucomicrobiota bacterium]|nr:DNA-3-methyladenine glycosylase [Verrucomicrobiota bacterium]
MKSHFLGEDFFDRSVIDVAQEMLGATLRCRQKDGNVLRMIVNETEAYDGEEDLACHASKGKTPRNEVMYGPAGVIYLYLCYGMHWLLNVVCCEEGYPAAVLIRGTLEVTGPGRLTKKLGITGELNRKQATPKSGLWFEKREYEIANVESGSRIGVKYAGKYWASKPYRFWFSKHNSGA